MLGFLGRFISARETVSDSYTYTAEMPKNPKNPKLRDPAAPKR